jgi:hypothetical protein
MAHAFTARVLSRYEAIFDYCHTCGFLRARQPNWLREAYATAISAADTGLVSRNISVARKLTSVLYFLFNERGKGRYLDIAGGYGILTRLMRDNGLDFYWSDKYCDNLMARGFEYHPDLAPCRAVTAIEIMEHLEDPAAFVCEALKYAQAGTFIFTTELFEGPPPVPGQWWYYSFETGQHISFFQYRTLEVLARRLGLTLASGGGLHVFSRNRISSLALAVYGGRASRLIEPILQKRLKGLTMQDHETLMSNISNTRS